MRAILADNLELFVQDRFESMMVEVWLIENGVGERFSYHYDGDNLVRSTIKEGDCLENTLKPFMRLPYYFSSYLFKAMAEYNSKKGIKTKDENLIEGKLLATEEHLKDMREMAKKMLDGILKTNTP